MIANVQTSDGPITLTTRSGEWWRVTAYGLYLSGPPEIYGEVISTEDGEIREAV